MQTDLTKRYSYLFERKGIKHLFVFIQDIYKSGKLREIASFIVWELFHKFRLFPRGEYLNFYNKEPISLKNETWNHSDFREKVNQYFGSGGQRILSSDQNWKLLFTNSSGEIYGCIYPEDRDLYKSVDNGKSVVFIQQFPERIKSIYISSQNTVFVCVKGAVYQSSTNGLSFIKVLDFGSSESFFRHNNGMTETPDKALIIGEYGNVWGKEGWKKLAYLYFSSDGGDTWERSDYLLRKGINKHVHVVKYSKLLNRLLVADGDNHKKLWISDPFNTFNLASLKWKPANRFHIQMGGYTALVESDNKILFGTDYQGGTNFLVESKDCATFTSRVVPDPYRRSPIDNMVQRHGRNGTEIWANLPYSTADTKCLLMYSTDGGEGWNKFLEYSNSTHKVWLLNSSEGIADELYFSIENLSSHERAVFQISDD